MHFQSYISVFNFLLRSVRGDSLSRDVEFESNQMFNKSPGQTEMQVENLGLLATPFGQALRALSSTCDHLPSI